jgi:hypothetical protein
VLARFRVMTWNMENLGVLKSSDPIGSGEHRVDDVDLACPRSCRSHRMPAEVSVAFPTDDDSLHAVGSAASAPVRQPDLRRAVVAARHCGG